MKKSILIIAVLALNIGYSQTKEERNKISESYGYKKESKSIKELNKKQAEERKKALDIYFQKNKSEIRLFEKEGILYEAATISPEGGVIYRRTFNQGSAKTMKSSSLHTGGSLGEEINGESMIAGIWDGGLAKPTHIEFKNSDGTSKITSYDGVTAVVGHSTHVAGTVAGIGLSPDYINYPKGYSKGIAPKSSILASDWNNDLNEMERFAKEGYLVSNHSYGVAVSDWENGIPIPLVPDGWWAFGAYDASALKADKLSHNYKYYQIIIAAGNDRDAYSVINSAKQGYELLSLYSTAKNTLTVAAIQEVTNYTAPSDVLMSDFSNYGPTDDGRVKPNISAKGVRVFSAYSHADDGYTISDGTSMASPAITGAILLLQQYYKKKKNQYMKSATVRGLLQHTAMEAGVSLGPDYSFGWGVADVEASALTISKSKTGGAIAEERDLNNREVFTKKIKVKEGAPLRVSISWTDPEYKKFNGDILGVTTNNGVQITGDKDPNEKYLVNDLDIKIENEQGIVFYPWKLDGKNPSAPATNNSTNDVDNFERIDIPNPKGVYTLTISHKGESLVNAYDVQNNPIVGSQEYTLIATGSDLTLEEDVSVGYFKTKIYPIPAKNIINISVRDTAEYSFYEISGKRLSSGNLIKGENTIDISNLSKGIYVIKLKILGKEVKTETKKIIIE